MVRPDAADLHTFLVVPDGYVEVRLVGSGSSGGQSATKPESCVHFQIIWKG